MATQQSRSAARLMMAPAVVLLLGWMLVPLIMTLFFSFKKYLPLRGDTIANGLDWVGLQNYERFYKLQLVLAKCANTLVIVISVLLITIILGTLLALLLDQPMWGQGMIRILVIAPFFVMPTVSALVWKNMFMDPVNGILAHLWKFFRGRAGAMALPGIIALDHYDCILAMATLRDPDPPDRSSIARP